MDKTSKAFSRARMITVFATFLAFMGIGVVDPILPVIAVKIGASHWQVEMLFTAYIFTMAFMMLPAGLIASRFGDKKTMVIGLCIVTVFAFLCGVSNTIPQLSLFRAGWGLGNSMFFATAMTLLIALSPNMNSAVGLYEAAIGLGMACGPLVGGLLGGYSWRYPFFGTSLLICIALLLVSQFVFEPQQLTKRNATGLHELRKIFSLPPFVQVAISGMLYYYGFFVVLAYSPLTLSLSPIQLGFVFFGWGISLAIGSAGLSHALEKRYTPKKLLPISLLFFVHSAVWQITFVILSGLVSGLNNALYTSYTMEVSPYQRSVTSGAYNFLRWLGAAIAPVLSGLIGQSISLRAPFLIASIMAFISFVLILIPLQEVQVVNKSEGM